MTPDNWENIWQSLPASSKNIFRSDSDSGSYWREFLAVNPLATFVLNDVSELAILESFLAQHQDHLCAGYFSYDLGMILKGVRSKHDRTQALAVFHAYEGWWERLGSGIQRCGVDREDPKPSESNLKSDESAPEVLSSLQFTTSVQEDRYETQIEKIHEYIRAGDFYQINYTQQLEAYTDISVRQLYTKLLHQHPAAYASYFECEDLTLHSLSPELFLHHRAGVLTTEPIKGTRPRGRTENEDEVHRQALLNSPKEQAELYMITDLLRNDLGEVCEIGSISLDAVKELRELPKVWHTYSRISGQLDSTKTPLEAFLKMFPGGSITGCPKKRALEVIDELEFSPRGIYTGSIGYFYPGGEFCFSIAIRTLIQKGVKLSLGTGGGITIDSKWEDEWEELLLKASTFA